MAGEKEGVQYHPKKDTAAMIADKSTPVVRVVSEVSRPDINKVTFGARNSN
jgi:hypothetical protein